MVQQGGFQRSARLAAIAQDPRLRYRHPAGILALSRNSLDVCVLKLHSVTRLRLLWQEMFEVGVRQKRFVQEAKSLGFKYHCGSVWVRSIPFLLLLHSMHLPNSAATTDLLFFSH